MDDRFERRAPSAINALDIFQGQWLSEIPTFGYGTSKLFDDSRISNFADEIGGFAGKKVIELGPLDGGHTYIMSILGASEIISIEANKDAFLRCLVIKEIFSLTRARFICGNFEKFLTDAPPRVDTILASGVIYHMADPLNLIQAMTNCADTICVWTHFYEQTLVSQNPNLVGKFGEPEITEFCGRQINTAKQFYIADVERADFAGGMEAHSVWITKDGLVDAFDALGFTIKFLSEQLMHPHGPGITFVARRRASRTPT